jgi:hypothetical protein
LIQIRTAANWGDEGALKNFPYAEFNGCHGSLVPAAVVVVVECCSSSNGLAVAGLTAISLISNLVSLLLY